MSQSALTVTHNVNIKVINRYGKVTRNINVHNKANHNMVQGILRFLKGDFDYTKYNPTSSPIAGREAKGYIPSEMRVGNIGVNLKNRSSERPGFSSFDVNQVKTPSFDEYRLQQELGYNEDGVYLLESGLNFDDETLAPYNDPNNSMSLIINKFYPAGYFVGFGRGAERQYYVDEYCGSGYGWVFYDSHATKDTAGNYKGEYETMITELGLYSSNGTMLARVVLDGATNLVDNTITFEDPEYEYNPILQSDSSSLMVQWRIGIISLGANDNIVSGSALKNLGMEESDNG